MSSKVSALDMPDVPMGQLPEHLHLQRTRVVCKADAPVHVSATVITSITPSVDLHFSMANNREFYCFSFKFRFYFPVHFVIITYFVESLIYVAAGNLYLHLKTEGIQYSGAYASIGVDNSVGVDSFCKNFKVKVVRLTKEEIEFDMIGIDASLANAFRRILIAEVQ
ncbi:hypothetical protein B296_00028267 [Ensete ventricosum]|uniref:DNA-directed RNA polymerase RpoA/D/Rpb3-type domain-containing protein n=1 Tax=Ensete ventricosum TaxID=4639 RepID=A0A426ZM88_ENSVE|nr:hypothetical protein B296_00028267 [Ensete ventricosum]